MTDRSLIEAELQNLQRVLEAKADMCIGAGKMKLLSFANACSDALELLKAKDINVPTKWVSVKDRLPEKSGEYLTVTTFQIIDVRHYSTRWKAFNAFDELDDDTNNLNETTAYWLPLTVLPEMPREGENHAE